jgi:hypothetical protein
VRDYTDIYVALFKLIPGRRQSLIPEAYRQVETWIRFRNQCGEIISPYSWIMLDLCDTKAAIRKNTFATGRSMPKKLSSVGVKCSMEPARLA